MLIIRKKVDIPINKNIGRIFRKYNFMEFKGIGEELTCKDFYNAGSYVCMYGMCSTENMKLKQMTLTFVCHEYPGELMGYFEKKCGYKIERIEDGIYYIHGWVVEMQLIVILQLSSDENLWMSSLTNRLTDEKKEKLIKEFEKHKNDDLYVTVMNTIVRANREKFDEEYVKELLGEE